MELGSVHLLELVYSTIMIITAFESCTDGALPCFLYPFQLCICYGRTFTLSIMLREYFGVSQKSTQTFVPLASWTYYGHDAVLLPSF